MIGFHFAKSSRKHQIRFQCCAYITFFTFCIFVSHSSTMIEFTRQCGATAHVLSTLVSLSLVSTQGHGIRNVKEHNNIEVLMVGHICTGCLYKLSKTNVTFVREISTWYCIFWQLCASYVQSFEYYMQNLTYNEKKFKYHILNKWLIFSMDSKWWFFRMEKKHYLTQISVSTCF